MDPEIDELVLSASRELLDRNDLSLDDDFFAAGGDSVLAVRLTGRIGRSTSRRVRATTLFANPVLRDFAAELGAGSGSTGAAASGSAGPAGSGGAGPAVEGPHPV
jgi:aryl carrier-like protein